MKHNITSENHLFKDAVYPIAEMNEEMISVVVPCYNENDVIPEAQSRISRICRDTFQDRYEIIYVDDGSHDDTWGAIKRISHEDEHVIGIQLSRNFGHQLALLAGLSVVSGSLILLLDADMQDPPELLPKMNQLLVEKNADVVFGRRLTRPKEGALKKVSAFIFYRLFRLVSDASVPLDSGDFRLMKRRIGDLILSMPERDRFTRGMIPWLGFKQVPYEYDRDIRFAGSTKYTMRKMLRLASDALISFSLLPLRAATILAGLISIFSIAIIAYTIWSWITYDTVPGWTSSMILISLFAGVQFAILGIMGEYIGRIYFENKRRPLFIVNEIIKHKNSDSEA